MSLDTRQKRASAINPASPWRGPMVDASELGFDAGDRVAALFLYSGLLDVSASTTVGGGWLSPEQVADYRRYLEELEEAREKPRKERKRIEKRIEETIRKAYLKAIGQEEKEAVEAVIAAVETVAPAAVRKEPDKVPQIDWNALLSEAQAIERILALLTNQAEFLEAQSAQRRELERRRLDDEEAVITLLMAA